MASKGSTEIAFGSGAGTNTASVNVGSQPGLYTGAYIEAFIMYEASTTRSADEQLVLASGVTLTCNVTNPDIGGGGDFTIYALSTIGNVSGNLKVRWTWV